MLSSIPVFLAIASLSPLASAHIAFWHRSMYGFNVTAQTFSYDNRPVIPLQDMSFDKWWFHGHLDYPPNDGDFFELPAGGTAMSELSCDKGATSEYSSSPGGKAGYPTDYPCPGQPLSQFHTTGENDLGGCALSIAYKSDVRSVTPEDLVVFSVNQKCVWNLNTAFQVPANMPACPEGGCICAWHWIHTPDSGAEQMYMNGFKCKVTGNTGSKPLGKPGVARRCGADPANGKNDAVASNCTIGAKNPLYWDQTERNNMFEGIYSPPLYKDLYAFYDGPQNDIFQDATVGGTLQTVSNQVTSTAQSLSPHGLVASSSQAAQTTTTPAADVPVTTPASQQAEAPSTPSPSPSAAPTPEITTSAASQAPASESTKKCSRKKRSNRSKKSVGAEDVNIAARHNGIKHHNKRRLENHL
ncbi:hypothetical protein QCA50_006115 [Cerrena zonata]|uniref:Lytic polysaccharide monooxygenase n=1 Tax=Cerrena zonata TaxID=2478898 RepID=A0AAW0GET0_9APHY